MARQRRLEYHKEGDNIFQVRFHEELDDGVTLSNPTAAVQVKTEGTDPEDWNTAAGVTVSDVTVVDAFDDEGNAISGASKQAVQFQIDADPDPQPDETDDPVPGTNYRVVVTADRSDAGDVVGKPGLTIHP